MGTHFQIKLSPDVPDEQWRPPSPGFYYIWRKSKEKEKPQGTRVLDYEEEQGRVKAKEKSNKKKKEALNKALEEQGLSPVESVNHEYGPSAILESMRKGWSSDKDVYQWVIQNPEKTLKWVQSELKPLGRIEQLEHPEVSNSQFFNPASGKGVHAAKTNYKSPGAINEVVLSLCRVDEIPGLIMRCSLIATDTISNSLPLSLLRSALKPYLILEKNFSI